MRHESERVKGKNYRPLGGRPLYHHIVATLLEVAAIDTVVIDTDSPLITEDAAVHFPSVTVIGRPEHLRGGDVPMNDVLLHDVGLVSADLFLQTHSTNPLLTARTIQSAIEEFLAAGPHHDSLFSVTPFQSRLWSAAGEPINHDPAVLLRTQDLEPVMEENSCMYLFAPETLRERRNRIGERPMMWPINRLEAWEIDGEDDWKVVLALLAARKGA